MLLRADKYILEHQRAGQHGRSSESKAAHGSQQHKKHIQNFSWRSKEYVIPKDAITLGDQTATIMDPPLEAHRSRLLWVVSSSSFRFEKTSNDGCTSSPLAQQSIQTFSKMRAKALGFPRAFTLLGIRLRKVIY